MDHTFVWGMVFLLMVLALSGLIQDYLNARKAKTDPPTVGDRFRPVAYRNNPTFKDYVVDRIENGWVIWKNKHHGAVELHKIHSGFVRKHLCANPSVNSKPID
ncbi:hypothetical protein [Neptuniibacter sp. QD37_11]|uniref:hypothetical protein n=1 Tax=Neptuniibacter sp. QD37_11 TaxID=3398209 RepID=UPI0039F46F2E